MSTFFEFHSSPNPLSVRFTKVSKADWSGLARSIKRYENGLEADSKADCRRAEESLPFVIFAERGSR